jgi:cytochrome c peroxidase
MPLRFMRLSTLLLGLAVAVAGCGGGGGGDEGGGGSSSPPPPPPVNQGPQRVGHNANQLRYRGHSFSYDANASGSVLRDTEGDPLTYQILFNSQPEGFYQGLSVSGSTVSGLIDYEVVGMTITITAKDSQGRSAQDSFRLDITQNSPPEVVQPNSSRIVSVGAVDYDATQSGATFRDADGHALTYSLDVLAASVPFTIAGTRLGAAFTGPGFVKAKLTATDELGAATDDVFTLVVPIAISARPALPPVSYVYDDALLDLPNIHRQSRANVAPLWDTTPPGNPTTNAGATLGRVLFYDKRLSITNTAACGSCHEQSRGFTLGTRFGVGAFGEQTRRNPMALANARYNLAERYFHDMRVQSLETLALMPIQDQRELGNTLALLEQKLAATDFYPPLFQAAFGTPEVTSDRVARALAQFLRSLISYRAKFDLAYHPIGDDRPDEQLILTAQELRGKDVFFENNCAFCHKVDSGAMEDSANNGLDVVSADPGRGLPRNEFRAASLRNIAVSGPYMHDGRFATLREVIDFYDSGVQQAEWLSNLLRDVPARTPRRLNLSEEDKQALEAFLNTFTDAALLADPKFSDPFL